MVVEKERLEVGDQEMSRWRVKQENDEAGKSFVYFPVVVGATVAYVS